MGIAIWLKGETMVEFSYTINFVVTEEKLTEEEECELIEFVNRFGNAVVLKGGDVALDTERRNNGI